MHTNSETSRQDLPIRVGTRASLLARTQTGLVVDQLRSHGHAVEVVTISTQGDRRDDVPQRRRCGVLLVGGPKLN